MIKKIKAFFMTKKPESLEKYTGVSDFMVHASYDTKKKVFTEAARRANEDQLKTFREARLKTRVN
ncbi:MAG: hypothetical protein AAB447_00705 [Patescibacteria group bacterium]